MLTCLDGTNRDYLVIVVSGLYFEILLGVSKLLGGSGPLMCQQVIKFVNE